jgi:hypothetical protein
MCAAMINPFWLMAQVGEAELTRAELRLWPRDLVDTLSNAGLLVHARTVQHAVCTECPDGHVEKVVRLEHPDAMRFFIPCPEHGRVEVTKDDLVEVAPNYDAFAEWLAGKVGAKEKPETVIPGALWRLGRVGLAGKSRDAWCLRAYQWDPSRFVDKMPKTTGSVIFIFGNPVGVVLPQFPADHVIRLEDVVGLECEVLRLDLAQIEARLTDAATNVVKRVVTKKRAKRAALIDAIKKHLREHIIAAKEHYRDLEEQGRDVVLYTPPTQKIIAQALDEDESSVSRAFNDTDLELAYLWKVVQSAELTIQFKS